MQTTIALNKKTNALNYLQCTVKKATEFVPITNSPVFPKYKPLIFCCFVWLRSKHIATYLSYNGLSYT